MVGTGVPSWSIDFHGCAVFSGVANMHGMRRSATLLGVLAMLVSVRCACGSTTSSTVTTTTRPTGVAQINTVGVLTSTDLSNPTASPSPDAGMDGGSGP